jgi:hypothetical protein
MFLIITEKVQKLTGPNGRAAGWFTEVNLFSRKVYASPAEAARDLGRATSSRADAAYIVPAETARQGAAAAADFFWRDRVRISRPAPDEIYHI